jgi:hypothetical protein
LVVITFGTLSFPQPHLHGRKLCKLFLEEIIYICKHIGVLQNNRGIIKIEKKNMVELTRQGQHRFKKGRITFGTLSFPQPADLQSRKARALDDNDFSLLVSLDLSAAFDVVDIELLIKRMKINGLPTELFE